MTCHYRVYRQSPYLNSSFFTLFHGNRLLHLDSLTISLPFLLPWLTSVGAISSISVGRANGTWPTQSGHPTRGDHKTLITCKARTALSLTHLFFPTIVECSLSLLSAHTPLGLKRGCVNMAALRLLHGLNCTPATTTTATIATWAVKLTSAVRLQLQASLALFLLSYLPPFLLIVVVYIFRIVCT